MKKLIFLVKGSAPEPYKVTFQKTDTNLSAHCTCPAGDNGQYCKHRFNILGGISEGIVSGNEVDVETVASWLPGTDVEAAINQLMDAEAKYEQAKLELTVAKKSLAIAFRD